MIGVPFEDNDLTCLGKITEIIAEVVKRRPAWLVELAARFPTTDDAAAWIRSLPQRDDDGLPGDGPKVEACDPWQRLRIPADTPNCVERTALWCALAELIDPWPVRRLATLDFDWGRHTFPIEEGEPIVLNPRVTEEELRHAVPRRNRRRMAHGAIIARVPPTSALPPAAAPVGPVTPDSSPAAMPFVPFASVPPIAGAPPAAMPPMPVEWPQVMPMIEGLAMAPTGPVAIDIDDAIAYTSQLARAGAQAVRNGPSRALVAHEAIHNLVEKGTAPTDIDTINAMAWFFATAEQMAQGYGIRALTIVRTTARAISDLVDDILAGRQRNLSFEIAGTSFEIPSWLSNLGSLAGKIGLNVGAAYVSPKLAALGITGQMVDLVEQELNAEGLTLGPIARPGKSFSSALNALSKRSL